MNRTLTAALAALALLSVADLRPAQACGGFFCNQQAPVLQSGEQIVFGVRDDGKIEMWIRIFYTGPAESFAWVLPAPANPEIGVGVEQLFDDLLIRTNLAGKYVLDCVRGDCRDCPMAMADGGRAVDDDFVEEGEIEVLQQGQTGPYDYVVLSGGDVAAILEWLSTNAYEVDDFGEGLLKPYVEAGMPIIAMRLTKGRDAGDIQPLRLVFDGADPMIPLRLTAVAASPDMPVHVWVFAEHRAVPANFRHVELNPVFYFGGMRNFVDTLNRAMDEGQDQAFLTYMADSPATLNLSYLDPQRHTTEGLADLDVDTAGFVAAVAERFGWRGKEMTSVMRQIFPLGEGLRFCTVEDDAGDDDGCVVEERFYAGEATEAGAYEFDLPLDRAQAVEVLTDRVVAPRTAAHSLVNDHAMVTRLTGTLSPEEMTLDPVFRLAPDAPAVPRVREAARRVYCAADDECADSSPRVLYFPGGFQVADRRPDDREAYEDVMNRMPAAWRVEDWGAEGDDPQVVVDNSDAIHAALADASDMISRLPEDALADAPPLPGDDQCEDYFGGEDVWPANRPAAADAEGAQGDANPFGPVPGGGGGRGAASAGASGELAEGEAPQWAPGAGPGSPGGAGAGEETTRASADGGCACAVGTSSPAPDALPMLLALLGLGLRRRR